VTAPGVAGIIGERARPQDSSIPDRLMHGASASAFGAEVGTSRRHALGVVSAPPRADDSGVSAGRPALAPRAGSLIARPGPLQRSVAALAGRLRPPGRQTRAESEPLIAVAIFSSLARSRSQSVGEPRVRDVGRLSGGSNRPITLLRRRSALREPQRDLPVRSCALRLTTQFASVRRSRTGG